MATAIAPTHTPLSQRQDVLIETNIRWLRQALRLVDSIDDTTYQESPPGFAPHRVGAHLRHVIEFYDCFLAAVESSHVDYDGRKREKAIETSRIVAVAKLRSIIQQLRKTAPLRGDSIIWVRMEDTPEGLGGESYLTSSIGRELQVLSSHTIHHFALIAFTLRAHGVPVDEDFGVAPSTLRHLALQKCAAPEAA